MKKNTSPSPSLKKTENSVKSFFVKTAWAIGKEAFSYIIVFILIDIIIGEILFYQFVIVTNLQNPQIVTPPVQFHVQTYQAVVGQIQVRQEKFAGIVPSAIANPLQ